MSNTNSVKATNKELFAEVVAVLNGDLKERFAEYVEKYNAKGDKAAAKRREKNQSKNAELLSKILVILGDKKARTRTEIKAELDITEIEGKAITDQLISSVLKDVDGVIKDKEKRGKREAVIYSIL